MVRTPQKIEVKCPNCGTKNTVLWFPWDYYEFRTKGSTGASTIRSHQSQEKVDGKCECGHKFKPDDLD
ncbi:MAG: hypothetical protein HY917_02595 [Candidatus Diapherotrites archaeon]|nr:hypothetical protein [Candidatus Diapherotrites archaeon]